jgi:hypothetical protein
MTKRIYIIIFLLGPFLLNAQRYNKPKPKKSYAKGAIFAQWGYNRSYYTKSDINFVGSGYNFTVGGCEAEDRPEEFSFDNYFNIKKLTVPQFNLRIGYVFKHNWAISLGYDHLKYVLRDNTPYTLTGQINPGVDDATNWSGYYLNEPIITEEATFHYENTNGLNYIRAEISRIDQWYREKNSAWFGFSSLLGFGAGTILSFNDFTFAGQKTVQTTSLSGLAASGHVDMRLEFFKHFYIQPGASVGYMLQNNVKTRPGDYNAIASHRFGYLEYHVVAGWLFYLRPVNTCDACPHW